MGLSSPCDSIVVAFNLTESLLDKANSLSSSSSHADHLQMSLCAPPHYSQKRHGVVNTPWVVTWINKIYRTDCLQNTGRASIIWIELGILWPISYLGDCLRGCQPGPPEWHSSHTGDPKICKQYFFPPESPCVVLEFCATYASQTLIYLPPPKYSASHPFTKVSVKPVLPDFS